MRSAWARTWAMPEFISGIFRRRPSKVNTSPVFLTCSLISSIQAASCANSLKYLSIKNLASARDIPVRSDNPQAPIPYKTPKLTSLAR